MPDNPEFRIIYQTRYNEIQNVTLLKRHESSGPNEISKSKIAR